MANLTKEQYLILENYQEFFLQARLGYIRGLYSYDVAKLKVVYESLGYRLNSPNCGACVLEMCKNLGEYFEKYNQENAKKDNLKEICREIKEQKNQDEQETEERNDG